MRGARYQRVRGILFLAVGLGTAGLVLILWSFGVLDSLERQSIDARFSIRGDRPAPKEIVFVAIDDVTTSYFDKTRWPYPRRYHAKVINRINAGHPRAIAVDIQFTEQTDPKDEKARFMSSWTSFCKSKPTPRNARIATSLHTPRSVGTSPPG